MADFSEENIDDAAALIVQECSEKEAPPRFKKRWHRRFLFQTSNKKGDSVFSVELEDDGEFDDLDVERMSPARSSKTKISELFKIALKFITLN